MKNNTCFAMENISDILTLYVLIKEFPELKGTFVKEIKYPWKLWWVLAIKVKTKETVWPWEIGIPDKFVKKATLESVLQSLVLQKDKTNSLTNNVLIKTNDKKIFSHIIHTHFKLQQGDIYFSSPSKSNDFYLIKIYSPSLWCLHLCEEMGEFEIYNNYNNIDSLFIMRGWQFYDTISNKLKIANDNIFLLKDGKTVNIYAVDWKLANEIITIEPGNTEKLEGDKNERVVVPLSLIPNELGSPCLWKVKNKTKLISLLAKTKYQQLAGFKAWFDKSGTIFIFAEGELVDTVLRSLLTDMFPGYIKKDKKVFFPNGKILMPALSERMLLNVYKCAGNYLCFDEDKDGKMYSWIMDSEEAQSLHFFIQYSVQRTIREIEFFEDQWQLDFTNLIDAPIVAMKGSENKQVFSVKKDIVVKEPKKLKTYEHKEVVALKNDILAKRKALDHLLVKDVGNADLWKKRGELSRKLGYFHCALIAEMTSCIILRDNKKLLSLIVKYQNEPYLDVGGLFAKSDNQDKILAQIRSSDMFSAELNYTLQLLFSYKFKDKDVLDNAIKSMRMGYIGTTYEFHVFRDFDKSIDKTSSIVHVKKETDILQKMNDFLQNINTSNQEQQVIIRKQFSLITENIIGKKILINENIDTSSFPTEWKKALYYLNNYNKKDILNHESHIKIWLEKISVRNITDQNLDDVFTGDLYRPVFDPTFKCEALKEIDELYNNYVTGGTEWQKKFAIGSSHLDNAKKQRTLLYLVNKYGPLSDFEPYIFDFKYGEVSFALTIMNCDIYRLCLKYNKYMDEKDFFEDMLKVLPSSREGYSSIDFCDGMENVILCLFLSSYNKRSEVFVAIFQKILEWLNNSVAYKESLTDFLALVALLQVGILNEKLATRVYTYNFYARKKSLWMNHANYIAQNGMDYK